MHIYYIVLEDGDDVHHPNVFNLSTSKNSSQPHNSQIILVVELAVPSQQDHVVESNYGWIMITYVPDTEQFPIRFW